MKRGNDDTKHNDKWKRISNPCYFYGYDRVYSANATPVSERPDLKMSANTQRALHVKIDGVEYLIHDDSVR